MCLYTPARVQLLVLLRDIDPSALSTLPPLDTSLHLGILFLPFPDDATE